MFPSTKLFWGVGSWKSSSVSWPIRPKVQASPSSLIHPHRVLFLSLTGLQPDTLLSFSHRSRLFLPSSKSFLLPGMFSASTANLVPSPLSALSLCREIYLGFVIRAPFPSLFISFIVLIYNHLICWLHMKKKLSLSWSDVWHPVCTQEISTQGMTSCFFFTEQWKIGLEVGK